MHPSIDLRFFYTVLIIVIPAYFAGRVFLRIYRNIRVGKNENLFDHWAARAWIFIKYWLLQKKMFKDFWPGVFHSMIFAGFLIVTIGSFEHLIEGLIHGFTFSWLFGPIYGPLTTVQDVLQALVVAAVLYFGFRRLVSHPKRLSTNPKHRRDGLIVLAFTGGHMIAAMGAFAFFVLAGSAHGMSEWRPVSRAAADLLGHLGFGGNRETTEQIAWIFWALHVGTVGTFLMYIPYSKHLHVFVAAPNIFFTRFKNRGTFRQIDFADETQTTYGVGKLREFPWKDILDAYTCTACGRCNEFCPTATTGKPLKPMKLIQDLKEYTNHEGPALAANKDAEPVNPLISEQSGITEDVIWACTTCRACVEACPVLIDHVDKIVDMRRHLVLMEGKMPAELQNTMRNWETQSNPWGMPGDSRDEWARSMNIPRLADKPDAEYLFYVGCAGSFNDRNKKITKAFAEILIRAGIDFAILGKEELCNGETARRAGNEYLAKTMIDANIEVMKRYNVKKILATCPHCFNTLKNEYPDFGFKAELVMHHTAFIDQLVTEGKLTIKPSTDEKTMRIAFHDSCYLGRYNDVYDAPRNLLRATGAELVEMPRSKSKGLCCGAGGARMWMEETIGKRINVERVEEALELKPQVIAAGCPFCQVMLTDGVQGKGLNDSVQVLDVAEIVAAKI